MLHCPFCGGTPSEPFYYDPCDGYQGNLGRYRIVCTKCKVYVDGDTRIKAIQNWQSRNPFPYNEVCMEEVRRRVAELKNIKDLVFVVRCKDCKHFAPYKDNKYSRGDCMSYSGCATSVSPVDFCSRGERRNQ